ncbi:MAG: hypothetical protein JXB49_11045 [Bacteroidales bacterium]|nr:hypothetical protein [Bacteroidales bacterium]
MKNNKTYKISINIAYSMFLKSGALESLQKSLDKGEKVLWGRAGPDAWTGLPPPG